MSSEAPRAITEALDALRAGAPVSAPLVMTWAVHEGIRGATWLTVHADGRVQERKIVGPPSPPIPVRELGRASASAIRELASALVAHGFDRIRPPPPDPGLAMAPVVELSIACGEARFSLQVPSPLLRDLPALSAIAEAFQRTRASLGA